MNISELLRSTSFVEGYNPSNTFTNKKFGKIYAYNKLVRTKPNSSIIEVSMMITGVTDMIKPAKSTVGRSVAAHKVMVAIRGVNQTVVSGDMLAEMMRATNPEYKDTEAYPNEDLIARAINPDYKPFADKTIMAQANGTYVIMEDKISKDAQIRVWCSCSSYYWVFQYYNVEHGVDIWGKAPARYIPKTKKGWEAFTKNKPMRNPGRHPGMCKHIMLLLALLMDSELVSEARSITRNYKANIERFKKVDRLNADQYNKLMKEYQSDHRRKLQQRDLNRTESAGASQLAGFAYMVGREKQNGWNKNLKWNPNTGHWRRGKK